MFDKLKRMIRENHEMKLRKESEYQILKESADDELDEFEADYNEDTLTESEEDFDIDSLPEDEEEWEDEDYMDEEEGEIDEEEYEEACKKIHNECAILFKDHKGFQNFFDKHF